MRDPDPLQLHADADPQAYGLPGGPPPPEGNVPPEYVRAFSVLAFAMNRFIVDHMVRASRLFEQDTESMMLFGVLSHLNTAHLLPPGTQPSTALNPEGFVSSDPQSMLRPVRTSDLAMIAGRPYETVRRRLERLRSAGRVLRVDDGWVLNVDAIDEPLRELTFDALRRFRQTAAVIEGALADASRAVGTPAENSGTTDGPGTRTDRR